MNTERQDFMSDNVKDGCTFIHFYLLLIALDLREWDKFPKKVFIHTFPDLTINKIHHN